jgi:hypothetical protein
MNGSSLPAEQAALLVGMDKSVGAVASQIFQGKITWDNLVELHVAEPLRLSRDWSLPENEKQLALALRNHLAKSFGQEAAFSQVCDTLINHLIDRGPSIWPAELNKLAEPIKTPA